MVRTRTKQKSTILIVEDDDLIQRLLAKLLSSNECIIEKAKNGNHALEIASRVLVALTILDLKLPDIDGMEILKKLKSIDHEMPVIIITAHGSPVKVRKAMEFGAFDFITKPFDLQQVYTTVQNALLSRFSTA